jgi:FMN reductase
MSLKILGVSGSLRENSYGAKVLRMTLSAAQGEGIETRLLDLRETPLPIYNPDDEETSAALEQVNAAVAWADAFVLATPDYHGSMSGAMKNFLDFHWETLAGKLYGYVCASHEKGLTAMDQMRTAVRQCYGWSLPYGLSVHGEQDFDSNGAPNARLERRIRMLARDLAVYGVLLRRQFESDVAAATADSFASRYQQH